MIRLLLIAAALLFINLEIKASPIDTTQVGKRYSKSELIDDVRYLTGTIYNVHPNMYHSITKTEYQSLIKNVNNALHDSMTIKELWPLFAKLIGSLNEGHSKLNYPDNIITEMKKGGSVLFPVLLREYDGTNLIVQGDLSKEDKLEPGDKITHINGKTAAQLIDTLSQHTGGLRSFRAIEVCRDIITYINMYNIKGPYNIRYTRDGLEGNAVVNSISWPDFRTRKMAQVKVKPQGATSADYSFKYLDKERAYLSLNTLVIEPKVFSDFLDSCFNVLKNSPTKTLIIDLRQNGGGNSVLAEKLLSYITQKPFRLTAGVNWKVSQEYKSYLKEKLEKEAIKKMDYYFMAANGSIIKDNTVEIKKAIENKLRYQGQVVVLIGPRTFSSANMLANAIQDYKLATLVGEPSGEPANDYGELINIRLPNTGLSITTSIKHFIRANGDQKDPEPVIPKYKVVDDPSTNVDEVLEYAKSL